MTIDELYKMMADLIVKEKYLQDIFCDALSNVEGKECDVNDVLSFLLDR